ncbi:hypothetical protein D3C76_1379790 [compost metagenome]
MTILTFAEELGYRMQDLTFSPITGGEGNIEFLVHWKLDTTMREVLPMDTNNISNLIDQVIKEATYTFQGNSSK